MSKQLSGAEFVGESRLPVGEYTGESQLPCGEYNRESLHPYDEYNEESRLPGLFGTSIRTGLQEKLLVPNTAGSHDSTVYSLQGLLTSWSI
jgi:hypothetical protein